MEIFTLAVIKGGTGKTTTCAALAQAAVLKGKRVLAIDLDPQANLTFTLNADLRLPGSYELLNGVAARKLIQQTSQHMGVIAASANLSTETTFRGSATRLKTALEDVQDWYDYIFIDTPPTIGEITFNALMASTGLIIPLESDSQSIQGLYHITDIAQQIQKTNPALSIKGILLTRFDSRAKINQYLKDVLQEKAKELGTNFLGTVRNGIAIREAQARRANLFEDSPKSHVAEDYLAIYEKLFS